MDNLRLGFEFEFEFGFRREQVIRDFEIVIILLVWDLVDVGSAVVEASDEALDGAKLTEEVLADHV